MTEFRLETDRLILRDWREEDWPEFFRLTNTPAVMRWLGWMDEAKQVEQRERVESCAAQHGHSFWVVERKADGGHLSGEMLGFCGLKRANAPGCPVPGSFEIGWRMREDAWGQGYAKEAATASLDAGFGRFGAEEIVALTVIQNEASWGLMTRLGMRRREDLDFPDDRYEPELRDTIVYSITGEEWSGR
ncbi:MAG: GNAT family N-acetyltransferase [Porphyrobacter sp.]|nr:GNAT family N-acetyltransferase [Porphyrobacter sp.]